jgi:trigger factor
VLHVEIPHDSVAQMYERTLRRITREAQVPGFRKGKVPRQIVLQRLGAEYVRSETLNDALPQWYEAALKEAEVDAVSMPELDLGDFDEGTDFSFTATVQVRPTPVLGQYRGLEVPKRQVEITDEQVDAQLVMLQERFASLQPVEDRPVKKGDFVLMDLAGTHAGAPIEGAQATDYMAQIGRGELIPGFEDALEGIARGEEKSFDVTFPDDYHSEELQGKDATFNVTVKEIKEKVVPELDDRFATEAGEYESVDQLRADIRERLTSAAEATAEREFKAKALDAAVANATVTVPPAMVDDQVHRLYHQLEADVGERGLTMDVYLGVLEKTREQVEEELRPRAEHLVRRGLVVDAVVKAEGLEVSDDELRERIKADAELLGRDANQLVLDLYKSGRHEMLREELLMAKAVDLIADHAEPVPLTDEEADEAEGEPEPQGGKTAAAAEETGEADESAEPEAREAEEQPAG